MDSEELSGNVIAAGIAVHRALGPGFIEDVYGRALAIELTERGIDFAQQVRVPIRYREREVGVHRLDLVVAHQLVVELKAVSEIAAAHFVVLRSYLRALECQHALILNFSKPTLEVRRVRSRGHASAPSWVPA